MLSNTRLPLTVLVSGASSLSFRASGCILPRSRSATSLEGEVGGKAVFHLMPLVAASTAHGAAVLFFPVLVRQKKRNIVIWQVAGDGTGMTRDR